MSQIIVCGKCEQVAFKPSEVKKAKLLQNLILCLANMQDFEIYDAWIKNYPKSVRACGRSFWKTKRELKILSPKF